MFWIGLIVGAILGANIGVVVAGLLVSARKNNAQDHLRETLIDHAVMDEAQEDHGKLPLLHRPVTYFDRFPYL